MYMKFSNFHFDNKNNVDKENKTTLDVIKEEKENIQMPRKTMLNLNDSDALTKGAVKVNIKEKKIEIKDYFHALMDDYGDDIVRYLMKNEKVNISNYANKDLFNLQDKKYFNEKNRSIIFNWLVKNNFKWKLKDDTIYMAMNLMDRYISKYPSKNSEFQLIAISSYLIASSAKNILVIFVSFFAFVIFNMEVLSLFGAISQGGIIIFSLFNSLILISNSRLSASSRGVISSKILICSIFDL